MARIISDTRNSKIVLDKNIIKKTLKNHLFWDQMTNEEKEWTHYLLNNFPIFQLKRYSSDLEKLINKEVRTYILWNSLNIKCPEIISYSKNSISMSYIEGDNINTIFNKSLNEKILKKVINKYQEIRNLAIENKDSLILHSDPQLSNFIYSNNQIIPIDSANILNDNISLYSLDDKLSLFFIYSIFNLEQNKNEKYEIIYEIINSFSNKEKNRLYLENNILKEFREKLPSKIKYKFSISNYSRKNISLVANILKISGH